jgi:hypothetical protein
MVLGGRKRSPGRFNYTDYIPDYNAGDNPLGDIADRDRPPQDTPPAEIPPDYQDPGLGGGDGSGSPSGVDPEDVPPAPAPPEDVPLDAGLGGGDGSGSASGVGPANDFTPHPMYNPETGEMVMANTYQEHLNLAALGYTHDRVGGSGAESGNDYALIGVISLLFFGGLILGLRK